MRPTGQPRDRASRSLLALYFLLMKGFVFPFAGKKCFVFGFVGSSTTESFFHSPMPKERNIDRNGGCHGDFVAILITFRISGQRKRMIWVWDSCEKLLPWFEPSRISRYARLWASRNGLQRTLTHFRSGS